MKAVRDEESTVASAPQQKGPKKFLIDKNLLPSRGRYYKSDLYARKLTAIECKDLSKVRKENVNAVFNKVIGSAISGVDLPDILVNDKLWLIFYLRAVTYDDPPMNVIGVCQSCENTKIYQYTLKDLDVKYADQVLPESFDLPNGDKISLRFPTIDTEIEVSKTKADPNMIENIDEDVMTIASHIRTINGEVVGVYEAYEYFVRGNGSAKDFSRLTSILRDYSFGAKPIAKFKCECGKDVLAEVLLTADFFLPKL